MTNLSPVSDPVAVIGIYHNHKYWLYDAAEFRPARPNEIWEQRGAHFTYERYRQAGREMTAITRVPELFIKAAYDANRYWPGDQAMLERELDETIDAFLAGAR